MTTAQLAANLTRVIINPLIALIFAIGLLVFVWGLIEFLIGINIQGDSEKTENGKRHMLWGVIGMFVMVAAYALFNWVVANICGSINSCYGSLL